jgi:acyl carrier protein
MITGESIMKDTCTIVKKFLSDKGKIAIEELDNSTEILYSGIFPSLLILSLMAFIEQEFNIEIKPNELVKENFKDIETISQFISKKLN